MTDFPLTASGLRVKLTALILIMASWKWGGGPKVVAMSKTRMAGTDSSRVLRAQRNVCRRTKQLDFVRGRANKIDDPADEAGEVFMKGCDYKAEFAQSFWHALTPMQ